MPFDEMIIIPLDFNLLIEIGIGGQKIELITDIHTTLDEAIEWLGVVPKDVVVTAKWFHDTFADKTSFSDNQMTRVFLMYALGC